MWEAVIALGVSATCDPTAQEFAASFSLQDAPSSNPNACDLSPFTPPRMYDVRNASTCTATAHEYYVRLSGTKCDFWGTTTFTVDCSNGLGYHWLIGPWSNCSADCAHPSTQTRTATCFDGNGVAQTPRSVFDLVCLSGPHCLMWIALVAPLRP